jgi:hypothetical protein
MARYLLVEASMTASRFASIILLAGFMGGCALDDVSGPGTGGDTPTRIPSDDPAVDERLDNLGIICESTLLVTGTVIETQAEPADHNGCWPPGTWKLTVAMDWQGCTPQEDISGEYIYEVTRDDESYTNIVYLADPDNERLNLKISAAGDGLCHAGFEHFGFNGDNRVVVTFQPTRQADNTLVGSGSYAFWEEDPY